MKKVHLDVMKPWIAERITTILGAEDDVVVEFIFSQLEERVGVILRIFMVPIAGINSDFISCNYVIYNLCHSLLTCICILLCIYCYGYIN